MKLPRNINGEELTKHLKQFGYHVIHQKGNHIRLLTKLMELIELQCPGTLQYE